MEAPPTSKIQVVLNPPLPGTCVICNKSANGQVRFLDFNFNLDWYGAVLICESCAKEVVEIVESDTIRQQTAEIAALKAELQEVRENNDRLNGSIDSLLSVRPNLVSSNDTAEQGVSEDTDEGTGSSAFAKPRTVQPSPKR